MLRSKQTKVRQRRSSVDDEEMAEIEADLDELESLLRKKTRRCGAPTVGGGTLRPPGRHTGLRPRPAAFAHAVADGLNPLAAAFLAGYRVPNRMTVWRLLRDAKVCGEIDRLKALK